MGRRAASAVEFALVGPTFFLVLLMVFEVAFDLFTQEVLDNALAASARQVLIGNTQATSVTGANFVSTYFCPYDGGLLNCNNVFVRTEVVTFTTASCQDFYDATTGAPPVVNGVLQLGYYWSGAGVNTGSKVGNSTCDTTGSSTGYVTPGPQQCVIMSAVYVEPSFLVGLVANHTTYNGQIVREAFSTQAFVTEDFPTTSSYTPC